MGDREFVVLIFYLNYRSTMKQCFLFCVGAFLWLLSAQLNAQTLRISQPIDGAVYQQNGQGTGRIIIRGDFNSRSFLLGTVYILIGKLQKLDLVNGQPTNDSPIQFGFRQRRTTFSQEVPNVPKGWYQLTITAQRISGGPFGPRTVVSSAKVGVGEVFVIAGQSNAQGGHGVIAPNTLRMDAVRVMNKVVPDYQRQDYRNLPGDYKEINQLTSTKTATGIGPLGGDLWYWASVGAQLAQDCQVPVAFFNAAYGGTTITNWASSTIPNARSSGQRFPETSINDPVRDRYNPGAPYGFFSNMLKLYASTYGIRAVLWMQGETDTKAIVNVNTPGSSEDVVNLRNSWLDRPLYAQNSQPINAPFNINNEVNEKLWVRNNAEYARKLAGVIATSRTQIPGKTIPWVIATTSRIGVDLISRTSPTVTEGQEIARINTTALKQGPYTDDLLDDKRLNEGADRPVHFNAAGADIVANRWASTLKDICRNNELSPVTLQDLGTEPQEVEISENGYELIAPNGYSGYKWVSDFGSFDLNAPIAETQTISAALPRMMPPKSGANSAEASGRFQVVLQGSTGLPILTQAVDLPYTIVDDTESTPPPTGQCKNGNEASGGNRTPSGAIVGGFGNSSEFMEYTFDIATAGSNPLSIRYASGDAQAGIDVVINGTTYPLRPAGTGSWTPSATTTQTAPSV
jgi:hypothetical protein